ncbi:hypothetical protein NPIL_187471 [Nephila pilipes]|uniref:Uncharacterized protein n=1 Tax=Nephila pilipes TaxID=299642 RepID=A0A8X6NCV8_NEPPI|nr:hypothetical protein NPIL_187471 [Nephila pilipes]
MARTKQTKQKKEKAESINILDPLDLESVTDDETEIMNTENENSTDQDRNKEACFLRTRMEEKFKEIVNYTNHYREKKLNMSIRKDDYEERQEVESNPYYSK